MHNRDIDELTRTHPSARLTIRIILEFSLAIAADVSHLFDGFPELGLVLITLLRGTDAIARLDANAPARQLPPTATSISALAASLERPFETVRKHVHMLVTFGWCEVTANGVIIPNAVLDRPETRALLDMFHDRLIGMIVDLKALDYPMPPPPQGPVDHLNLYPLSLEFFLKTSEMGAVAHGGWLNAVILMSIMVANARPVTLNAALARRYARSDTPPPDSLRVPVGMRALARTLCLSYPTVRRHVEQMIGQGRIARRDGGLIVPVVEMQRPNNLDQSRRLNSRLNALLKHAGAAGLPLGNPAQAYLHARPPLLDFG